MYSLGRKSKERMPSRGTWMCLRSGPINKVKHKVLYLHWGNLRHEYRLGINRLRVILTRINLGVLLNEKLDKSW